MPLAEACVSHTSGLAIRRKTMMVPATDLAMPSASERPMRLGTSSPITIERYDTIRRNDDGGGHRRHGGERGQAERLHPAGKWVGKRVGRDGGREEADERDGNLDGGQEVRGVRRQLKRLHRALVALLGIVLERSTLRRGERHLGHGEKTVQHGEQYRGDDRKHNHAHGYEFKPPKQGEK